MIITAGPGALCKSNVAEREQPQESCSVVSVWIYCPSVRLLSVVHLYLTAYMNPCLFVFLMCNGYLVCLWLILVYKYNKSAVIVSTITQKL